MSIARSYGPVAQEIKKALEQYSKEELVDLLTHLVKTYVVEGTLPLKPEVSAQKGDEKLAGLTFPQLIMHLQMHLDHREWSQFSVSGEDVWVTSEGQRINLTGRQAPLPASPAPAQEVAREPTSPPPARDARPPRVESAPATPARTEPPAAPATAPRSASVRPEAPATARQPDKDKPEREDGSAVVQSNDVETTERFGMLEFD